MHSAFYGCGHRFCFGAALVCFDFRVHGTGLGSGIAVFAVGLGAVDPTVVTTTGTVDGAVQRVPGISNAGHSGLAGLGFEFSG